MQAILTEQQLYFFLNLRVIEQVLVSVPWSCLHTQFCYFCKVMQNKTYKKQVKFAVPNCTKIHLYGNVKSQKFSRGNTPDPSFR